MSDTGADTSILCFGEVLLRLTPHHDSHQGRGWFNESGNLSTPAAVFEAWWGGSEANVAVGVAQLGSRATVLTTTPDQELGSAAKAALLERGVALTTPTSDNENASAKGRMGLYFAATQASGKTMVYDRDGSTFALSPPKAHHVDWESYRHFHTSGINPALNQDCAEATNELLATAKRQGLTTSFDLNLRRLLWSDQEAGAAIAPLLPHVDTLLAHAGQLSSAFALGQVDLDDPQNAGRILSDFCCRYEVPTVIVTGREKQQATDQRPNAPGVSTRLRALRVTRDSIQAEQTPWFAATDRIGSGDAFTAGLLAAEDQGQDQLHWALAAASLANQSPGDFPTFDRNALIARTREFFGSP